VFDPRRLAIVVGDPAKPFLKLNIQIRVSRGSFVGPRLSNVMNKETFNQNGDFIVKGGPCFSCSACPSAGLRLQFRFSLRSANLIFVGADRFGSFFGSVLPDFAVLRDREQLRPTHSFRVIALNRFRETSVGRPATEQTENSSIRKSDAVSAPHRGC